MPDTNGVVYTKEWVVNLILDIAGYKTDKQLWKQSVLEPSCGHASFLVPIVNRLIDTAVRDNKLDASVLENCIVGYDLDKSSVSISRKKVMAELVRRGLSNNDARHLSEKWVRQGDYLLGENHEYDYVIGNPPYVKATDISLEDRDKYCLRLSAVTKGCDLFVGFIQHGLEDLKQKTGVLCYICADRWMQNQYGRNLRGLIYQNYHIDTIIRMHDVDAFETEVSAYPAIIKIDQSRGHIKYIDCNENFTEKDTENLIRWMEGKQEDYRGSAFSAALLDSPTGDRVIPLANPYRVKTVTNLMNKFPSLEDSGVKLGIGLATGKDDVFIVHTPDLVERDRMLPAFNMRDWRRNRRDRDSWIVNPWDRNGSLVSLADYPQLKSYLEKNKSSLAKRHVARKNSDAWYRTIDKVNWSILGMPMLLFPDMAAKADPVYSDGEKYPCHNCYWLISDQWDIKVLGGLLMSETAESFIDALGVKMRGGTMRFQAQYLRLIHVPSPSSIDMDTADMLREAFENQDREAASRAALRAYGLEG